MSKAANPKPRKVRQPMFQKGRTVSFKMDEAKANAAVRAAYIREIPFSMWMREAAEDKMEREKAAR